MNDIKNQVTTLIAPEITCGGCAASIKKALGNLDGVSEVTVETDTKQVSVAHEAQVSRAAIISALDRAGFSAE